MSADLKHAAIRSFCENIGLDLSKFVKFCLRSWHVSINLSPCEHFPTRYTSGCVRDCVYVSMYSPCNLTFFKEQASGKLAQLREKSRKSLMGTLTEDDLSLFFSILKANRQGLSIVGLLRKLAAEIPGFAFRTGSSSNNSLHGFVCMTGRQRQRLADYGQLLMIDATYSVTKVTMPRLHIWSPTSIISSHLVSGGIFVFASLHHKRRWPCLPSWIWLPSYQALQSSARILSQVSC